MHAKHRVVVFLGLVGGLVLFGSQAALARSSKACKLLTRGEINSAIGGKVGAGQSIGSKGCQWYGGGARATLTILDAAGWGMMKTPLPGVTKTTAKGIGNDAFYTTVSTLTTLSAKKGRAVIVVRLYGVKGKSKQMSAEKILARDVLKRL